MNHYETKTNGTIIGTPPLFASVWLALFSELRKSFTERHLETEPLKNRLNSKK